LQLSANPIIERIVLVLIVGAIRIDSVIIEFADALREPRFDIDDLTVLPKIFEVVKFPLIGEKHVDEDVAVIEEDPAGAAGLPLRGGTVLLVHGLLDEVGDGAALRLAAAGEYDDEGGDVGDPGDADRQRVYSLALVARPDRRRHPRVSFVALQRRQRIGVVGQLSYSYCSLTITGRNRRRSH